MTGLGKSRLVALGIGAAILLAIGVVALSGATAEPMTASAGGDRTLECASPSGALVPLDASASRAATNDSISNYTWYEAWNTSSERVLGQGIRVNVTLGLGAHNVTLRVENGTGDQTAWDNATIHIVDTVAPIVTVTPSVASIGPPNHKMTDVTMSVRVSDACSATHAFTLKSVTSNEADDARGDGHTVGDIEGVAVGTADTDFQVRAERAGPGDGRVYTFTYEARDGAGNVGVGVGTVTIPHG